MAKKRLTGADIVGRDHELGRACKYGCVPARKPKCRKCDDKKCTERKAEYDGV